MSSLKRTIVFYIEKVDVQKHKANAKTPLQNSGQSSQKVVKSSKNLPSYAKLLARTPASKANPRNRPKSPEEPDQIHSSDSRHEYCGIRRRSHEHQEASNESDEHFLLTKKLITNYLAIKDRGKTEVSSCFSGKEALPRQPR